MSDTWLSKMSEGLTDLYFSDTENNRESFKKILRCAFESYAEMKTVKLKVQLMKLCQYLRGFNDLIDSDSKCNLAKTSDEFIDETEELTD